MSQNMVILALYEGDMGSYCGTARIRRAERYADIQLKAGKAAVSAAQIYLLCSGGVRAMGMEEKRAPIEPQELVYGIAALDSMGVCLCSGYIPEYKKQFGQGMVQLRLTRGQGTGREQKKPAREQAKPAQEKEKKDEVPIKMAVTPATPQENIGREDTILPQPEPDGTVIAPSTKYRAVLGKEPEEPGNEETSFSPETCKEPERPQPWVDRQAEEGVKWERAEPAAEKTAEIITAGAVAAEGAVAESIALGAHVESPERSAVEDATPWGGETAVPWTMVEERRPVMEEIKEKASPQEEGTHSWEKVTINKEAYFRKDTPVKEEIPIKEGRCIEGYQGAGVPMGIPMGTPEGTPSGLSNSEVLQEILERAKAVFPERAAEKASSPDSRWVAQEKQGHAGEKGWRREKGPMPGKESGYGHMQEPWGQEPEGRPHRCENPFPSQFPGSSWIKVQQGNDYYLEGRMRRGSELVLIMAVPGKYSPVPPKTLPGFSRFIQTRSGGFWVKTTREKD